MAATVAASVCPGNSAVYSAWGRSLGLFRFCNRPAGPWEYRLRAVILFSSQLLLALIVDVSRGGDLFPQSRVFPVWSVPLAILLGTVGLAIRIWGTSVLSAEVVTGFEPTSQRLVTSGPFGIVRNPLYIGTMLMFAGFAALFGWIAAVAFLLFHFIRNNRVVCAEEELLNQQWGRQFSDYCRKTNRWLPGRLPGNQPLGPFCTRDGILGNVVFVSIWVGLIISIWTANLWNLLYCELLGVALALVHMQVLKAKAVLPEAAAEAESLTAGKL